MVHVHEIVAAENLGFPTQMETRYLELMALSLTTDGQAELERIARNLGLVPGNNLPAFQTPSTSTYPTSAHENPHKQAAAIVLQQGGVSVFMSVMSGVVHDSNNSGFQEVATRMAMRLEPPSSISSAIGNHVFGDERVDWAAQRNGITEFLDTGRFLTKQIWNETRPAASGVFGIGRRVAEGNFQHEPMMHNEYVLNGKNEPAMQFTYLIPQGDWRDYSGRKGQSAIMRIVLAESDARVFGKILQSDPAAIRTVFETVMKEKILIHQKDWSTPQNYGDPISPPYGQWSRSGDGGLYVVDWDSPGFYPNSIYRG